MNRKTFLATLGTGALSVGATRMTPAESSSPAASPAAVDLKPAADLSSLISLADIERRAREVMTRSALAYVSGGAADEITVRWNQDKYRDLRLHPRVLRDVGDLDPSTTLFGQRLNHPIILAPTANHRVIHPEGELATARGANAAGAIMVLSSGANTAVEEVAKAVEQPLWFQLYVAKDRGLAKALIQRVEAAGARGLCVTVDSPLDGARDRQARDPISLPPGVGHPHYVGIKEPPTVVNLDVVKPQVLLWRDIEWIRSLTAMPLMLKGVMSPEDAEIGVELGADGIIVSNHGGRCLDTQPATIEALPRVVDRVAGRVPVIVDGGIRRGTDVIKALALGAAAVQIGRPYLYGLAVGGASGVAHTVKVLRQELLMAMALLGCRTLRDLNREVLWAE
jgi:4-hydroxymandelate oxidase